MGKEAQNFANHGRLDPPFHFFLVPVALITTIAVIVRAVRTPSAWTVWDVVIALATTVAVFKIRLYALRVQDRVIRLEERVRMMAVLPPALRARVGELSDTQYVGLRFASDEELPGLVQRALDEKLSRKQIKQAVKDWRADYSRI